MAGTAYPRLHHVTLKTRDLQPMVRFYEGLLRMRVNHVSAEGAWMTNDDANHRVALLAISGLREQAVDPTRPGMHHMAFEHAAAGDLIDDYERLSELGIEPFACVDHGVTLSLYYADPDGNNVELQVDNFSQWSASSHWMLTSDEFAHNPIGVNVDPRQMRDAWRAGLTAVQLHARAYAGDFDPHTPIDLHLRHDA